MPPLDLGRRVADELGLLRQRIAVDSAAAMARSARVGRSSGDSSK